MKKKAKVSQNEAQAVETQDYQPSIDYIDRLMQKAPASRQEHIMGQQALSRLAHGIQELKRLPGLLQMIETLDKEAGRDKKQIDKLQKQLAKLKGK